MSRFVISVLFLLLIAPITGAQQLVEEDLPEPAIWDEVVPSFEEAEEIFNSASQADSLVLFDTFLNKVGEAQVLDEPTEEIFDLVAKSYFYRAQVNHNLGSTELVSLDLESLLGVDPGFDFDRALVSTRLAEQFDSIKSERVASILVAVDPPDATVAIGRWQADLTGMLYIPTGNHIARIERVGYAPVDLEIAAEAGLPMNHEIVLERTSAVLTILTELDNVEVLIDGGSRGFTAFDIDPSSGAILTLEGLQTGGYELAARRDGYREYVVNAPIEDLRDYTLGPIELVATSGVVALNGMPPGTVVRANGDLMTPAFAGSGAQLNLSPGDYQLSLAHPDRGLFEIDVFVEDQQAVEVDVRLRPPLVLLGILGGDTSTATRLTELLGTELGQLGSWALIDRSDAAEAIVEAAGVDVAHLRAYAQTGSRQAIPWAEIQSQAGERAAEGSVYMLGVLSDDLLAETVHMFLFPEAPLPSRPDQVDLTLDAGTVKELAGKLDSSVLSSRAVLGAIVVDSPAAAGPLVVQVSEGGPAQQAGLGPGDEIIAVDGTAIQSVNQLHAELDTRLESHLASGQMLPIKASSAAGERDIQFGMAASPVLMELGATDALYSIAAYQLSIEEQNEESGVPKWIVQLNQAVVFLRGGDLQGAIQLLRLIEAPAGERLGDAQVNYLTGLALSSAGGEYAQTASGFLTRAAEEPDGRLYHDDGALIAPRAQIRLRVLN